MKVLLLGPTGQLGSDLVRACEGRADLELTGLGRDSLDVSELDRIEPLLSGMTFDVLVNCTSYHRTDECEREARTAFAINAHAVRNLARACRARAAKFLHISTDYVFDGRKISPYSEEDCPRPLNVYGASKAMGETLASLECDRLYVLRVASLFGTAGSSAKGGNFVETMLRLAREKGEVRVVADTVMSPTATADVSAMIVGLLERDAPPGIYHAVNDGQASWFEFADAILEYAGIDAKRVALTGAQFPGVARRPAYSVLSNEKIRAAIGPVPHWRDALRRYLSQRGSSSPRSSS